MRGRLTFSREGERVRATLRGGSQALIVLYNGRWAARWPGVTIVTELHCAPGMCFTSFGSVPASWFLRGDPTDWGCSLLMNWQEVCQVAYKYCTFYLSAGACEL